MTAVCLAKYGESAAPTIAGLMQFFAVAILE